VHCVTKAQGKKVLAAITERMGEVGLRLHPDKTHIVYCKDGRRRGGTSTRASPIWAFPPRQGRPAAGAASTSSATASQASIILPRFALLAAIHHSNH
jgi:hypothetical protein